MDTAAIRREQLDKSLPKLKAQIPARPKSGWIAEIRKALMMTTSQLAKRLGVDQSTLSRLEKSEVKNTITLDSLERVANALNCDVHYAFVPRQSLDEVVFNRAKEKMAEANKRLEHTLGLENQKSEYQKQLDKDISTAFFLHSERSRIWDEE